MPMACNAMWRLSDTLEHTVVHQTPSGRSSSLEIEYHLDARTINAVPPPSSRRVSQPEQEHSPSPSAQGVASAKQRREAHLPDADLYLVACVKRKATFPAPARKLYFSCLADRIAHGRLVLSTHAPKGDVRSIPTLGFDAQNA